MASSNASMVDGQAFKALIWPIRSAVILGMLIGIFWIFCVTVQVVFALKKQPDAALNHVKALAKEDLLRSAELPTTLFSIPEAAIDFGNATKHVVQGGVTSGLRTLLNTPDVVRGDKKLSETDDHDPGGTFAKKWWKTDGDTVDLILSANYIFAVRTLMFSGCIPLVLLLYFVGLLDGRSGRAIRRADAMRESSNIYHRAKIGQLWAFSVFYLGYLSLPFSLNPVYILIPCAFLCAFLWRTQIAYYKKYA